METSETFEVQVLQFDGRMAAATMTKDELRSALSDAGVTSPSSARKDELMALYDSVQSAPPGGVDFSADDEEEVALATLKKSKKGLNKSGLDVTANNDSLVLGDFDVSQLTDDQLCEALIERQIQVGPIVDSTRKLYRRKLVNAMREETVNGSTNGQNGTAENGHNESTEQLELQNGDFSADDEEILNGGGDDGNGVNDDDVEDVEEVAAVETEEDEEQPSVVVKKAATPVTEQTSPLASIRKRFMGPDSTDAATASSNGERFTPTPRRSIHSYKVTETTRQTLTKGKDGTVTHDFDYKKETSESKGALGGSRGKLATVLRLLPGFFLILLFLVLAYYVYTKRK